MNLTYQSVVDGIGVAVWEWRIDGEGDTVGENGDEDEVLEGRKRKGQGQWRTKITSNILTNKNRPKIVSKL